MPSDELAEALLPLLETEATAKLRPWDAAGCWLLLLLSLPLASMLILTNGEGRLWSMPLWSAGMAGILFACTTLRHGKKASVVPPHGQYPPYLHDLASPSLTGYAWRMAKVTILCIVMLDIISTCGSLFVLIMVGDIFGVMVGTRFFLLSERPIMHMKM